MADTWAGLEPRFTWRPSQRSLLDALAAQAADDPTDRCWHLCAPPGSGKTLVGLELARRTGGRTLVLSPTTAIRDQWCSSTRLFGADPDSFSSTEIPAPTDDAPVLVSVTYQLLGNPGTASDDLRATARRMWERAADDPGHRERIETLEATDPTAYRRELNTWIRSLRRSLADPDTPLPSVDLLGERATALIDRIASAGIDTIVLDECHHLLDWWALVIDETIAVLDATRDEPVRVIGLTATLPEPGSATRLENYRRILGEVDVTVPMAALVIDGELAPWRDGVWCVTPTDDERQFLDGHRVHLDAALDALLATEEVVDWLVASLLAPALADRSGHRTLLPDGGLHPTMVEARHWRNAWNQDPQRAAAIASWWRHRGLALPIDADLPGPVGDHTTWERLELLWQYAHHPRCSAGVRRSIRETLGEHGIHLTTAGVRTGRRITDLVASRSAAKFEAAATIVARELDHRHGDVCALVAVEADRSELPAAARGTIDDSDGTMVRALATIARHPEVLARGVAAVSGRGLWIDALTADDAVAIANTSTDGERPDGGWLSVEGTPHEKIVRIVEQGSGWSSAHRVRLATRLLAERRVATLVGTRSLLGEGWNHPPLNVLVDCSEAATANAVTQLRGRAVRLDPATPTKTVSLWDVVTCDDEARADWARTRRKHQLWWGLDADDVVSCGPTKLGTPLSSVDPPSPRTIEHHNATQWSRVADHDRTRRAWAASTTDATGVPELTITPRHRRSITIDTPRRRRARRADAVGLGLTATAAGTVGAATGSLVVALVLLVAAGGPIGWHLGRRLARRTPVDDPRRWIAVGEAVAAGLDAAGRTDLAGRRVSARTGPDGVAVSIAATGSDAETWVESLHEMLGPLGTPRWLVVVDEVDEDVEEVWRVPTRIGATRAAAEAFTTTLTTWLPHARLVRGGTDEATELILRAADRRRDLLEIGHHWTRV